jgi:hypothetical protein
MAYEYPSGSAHASFQGGIPMAAIAGLPASSTGALKIGSKVWVLSNTNQKVLAENTLTTSQCGFSRAEGYSEARNTLRNGRGRTSAQDYYRNT